MTACPIDGEPLREWARCVNEDSRYVHVDGTRHGGLLELAERDMTSTPPFTYDDLVRMYQQMMNEPYRPYVDIDQLPTPPPIPSASDRSGYAEYLLTGHYPLRPGIADRCAP